VVEVVLVVATVLVGAVELEVLDDVVEVGPSGAIVVVVSTGSVEEVDVVLEGAVDELVLLDVDGGRVELTVDAVVLVVDATTVAVVEEDVDELELVDGDVEVVVSGVDVVEEAVVDVDDVLVLVAGALVVDVVTVAPVKVAR
jgi:hypothetical protein